MVTTLIIEPCLFADDALNTASQHMGQLKTTIFGNNKRELFENIREKIRAMAVAEARIEDETIAKEYNSWIAKINKQNTPEKIDNYVDAMMRYALPFSEKFKMERRKN